MLGYEVPASDFEPLPPGKSTNQTAAHAPALPVLCDCRSVHLPLESKTVKGGMRDDSLKPFFAKLLEIFFTPSESMKLNAVILN